jgi:hypothetical protein
MLFKVLSIFSLFIFATSNPIRATGNVNGNVRRQWDEAEEEFDAGDEWNNDFGWDYGSFFDEDIVTNEEDTSKPEPTGTQQILNNPLILIQAGQGSSLDSSSTNPATATSVTL